MGKNEKRQQLTSQKQNDEPKIDQNSLI